MTWRSRIVSSAPHSARVTIDGAGTAANAFADVVLVAGLACTTWLSSEATATAPAAPAAASRKKRRRGNVSSPTHCSHMGSLLRLGLHPRPAYTVTRRSVARAVIAVVGS